MLRILVKVFFLLDHAKTISCIVKRLTRIAKEKLQTIYMCDEEACLLNTHLKAKDKYCISANLLP